MTALLALVVALVAPVTAHAAQTPRAMAAKTVHDFGTVGIGTEPAVDFSITNDGAAPLHIDVAPRLAAGLRLVHVDKTIAPAASGMVRLAIDTFRAGATMEWRVPVTTNDPAQPTLTLTLKADVRQFIAITPASSRISFVQYAAEGGTRHVVAAIDDATMAVLGVDSPFDYIRATWRELKPVERDAAFPGRQWQIDLTILAHAPVGPIGGHVIVRTTHAHQPRAFLPVTGFVRPLFAVTPRTVTLQAARTAAADAPRFSLIVKNFGAEPAELTGASSDIAGLQATIVPFEPGHAWRVEVRMTPPPAGGTVAGTLTLKTGSSRVPELTVPIQLR